MPFGTVTVEPVVSRDEVYVKRFGECLAWMSMGAGVSWFDDHEPFDLKVPLCAESCDLRMLADERCEGEWVCPWCDTEYVDGECPNCK